MSRSSLSESDFRRLRQELFRRAHETGRRIEAKVKKLLEDTPAAAATAGLASTSQSGSASGEMKPGAI